MVDVQKAELQPRIHSQQMDASNRTARLAGVLYVLGSLPEFFSAVIVQPRVLVRGDAVVTANNLRVFETLVRLSVLGELLSAVVFLFAVLAFYRLLSRVDAGRASLMVIFWAVSIPVAFVAAVFQLGALAVVNDPGLSASWSPTVLDAVALLLVTLHSYGVVVETVFWGLWLVPLGLLLIQSRFLPPALGVLLVIAGCSYVLAAATAVMWPSLQTVAGRVSAVPGAVGEGGLLLWIFLRGVDRRAASDSTVPPTP